MKIYRLIFMIRTLNTHNLNMYYNVINIIFKVLSHQKIKKYTKK